MESTLTLILLVVAGVLFAFAALPRAPFNPYAIHLVAGGALALTVMLLVARL